jgi:hypothetical protein
VLVGDPVTVGVDLEVSLVVVELERAGASVVVEDVTAAVVVVVEVCAPIPVKVPLIFAIRSAGEIGNFNII